MAQLLPLIQNKHQWVMFCDDDDTYEPNRNLAFLQTIMNCTDQILQYPDKQFIGVYESTFGKNHKEQRHEFWCYCIHISMLSKFMSIVTPYPDILDHTCCDVLFGEYLRRSTPQLVFGTIHDTYYNYRVDNNSDSITGDIKEKNKLVLPARTITMDNRMVCAKELNEYLDSNIQIYIHDTYVRTIIGNAFDDILRSEFKSEYEILDLIDNKHIDTLMTYHNRLKLVVNSLYDYQV